MMKRPERLFHASQKRDLERIEPRNDSVRDPEEGPRVFATPDKRLATAFMTPLSETSSGYIDGEPYLVALKDEFLARDKGGSIYHLHPDEFESDPAKGLGLSEWTASHAVSPTEREDFENALQAMLDHGVKVYLVDSSVMNQLRTGEDPSDILRDLSPINDNEV